MMGLATVRIIGHVSADRRVSNRALSLRLTYRFLIRRVWVTDLFDTTYHSCNGCFQD